jgi:hypothetical protein
MAMNFDMFHILWISCIEFIERPMWKHTIAHQLYHYLPHILLCISLHRTILQTTICNF